MPDQNTFGDDDMSNMNEWLFDAIWDLSDRSLTAGYGEVASKLEEAMDAYLAETGAAVAMWPVFKSCRSVRARRRNARGRTDELAQRRAAAQMKVNQLKARSAVRREARATERRAG